MISETPSMKFGKLEAEMFSDQLGDSDGFLGKGGARGKLDGSRSSSNNSMKPFKNQHKSFIRPETEAGMEQEDYRDDLEDQIARYNQEKRMNNIPKKDISKDKKKKAVDILEPNFGKLKGLFESPNKLENARKFDDSMDSYGEFQHPAKISRQLSPPKKMEKKILKGKS